MKDPQTFEEAIDVVMGDLKELLVKKQRWYGHRNILSFGQMGVMVRVSDKVERIKNLYHKKINPKEETVIDTWKDLANYAIIWLLLQQGIFELPLTEEKT